MAARHAVGASPFEKAGGFAPTMGIIGTVLGLVHVLQNLAAPSTLGPSISAAFIATLMGVGSANVIFLPIANRLKAISAEEVELRMMTVEGILSIQAGDNPRLVSEKLMSYVPPAERSDDDEQQSVAPPERRVQGSLKMARGRGRRRGGAHSEESERALAVDLRGHDHAADGAVHGPVLDLLGQHLQVQDPAAIAEGRLLGQHPSRRQGGRPTGLDRELEPDPRKRRTAGDRAGDHAGRRQPAEQQCARHAEHRGSRPAGNARTAREQRVRADQARARRLCQVARLQLERADVDRTARPGHQGAHRRPAVPFRPSDARRTVLLAARGDRPAAEHRRNPPDRRRRQHRQRPDPQRPVLEQLGALDRPRQRRRGIPGRTRGRRAQADGERQRRPASRWTATRPQPAVRATGAWRS